MLPVTASISSRPASAMTRFSGGPVDSGRGCGRLLGLFRLLRLDLAADDLLQRNRGPLPALRLDLGLRATVELSASLRSEHDEHVAVRDLLESLLQRWERHHAVPPGRVAWTPPPTGRSGRVRVRRDVRPRSASMVQASWRNASSR